MLSTRKVFIMYMTASRIAAKIYGVEVELFELVFAMICYLH